MIKVFKNMDADGSGFIDVNELKDISKELGRPLDPAELEECMKDLDYNKDNKISFEEFS
jgi:Ca2+-binding EF-hand superfamily protein